MSEAQMTPAYITRQSNVATGDDASVMLEIQMTPAETPHGEQQQ